MRHAQARGMRTSNLLIVLAFATSAFSFGACGGKTVGIAGLTGNGSGSGTRTSHGTGTGTGLGSGSGTSIGSGTGTSVGSGTGTSVGSGTGTWTGSGSGTGTWTGSGSGSGFGCAGPQPDCPWCDGTVPAVCTEMGWECPPPPPCVGPGDAGFGLDTSFPDTSFPDAGFGAVVCGAVSCSTSAFYCLEEVSGNQTTFSCADYPPPCSANPSCACLIANEGNCACSDDGNGGLLLTCAPLPP